MNKFIKFTVCAVLALLIVSLVHGEPLAARQYGDDPTTTDAPKSKLPIPDATPTASVDTFSADTTYGAPSVVPSASFNAPVPSYTPSGTGSLISQWASLTAKGVPANPTGAPAATAPAKAAETPSSANKFESGLINVAIIAGIVSYFY